jgi:hypothetical protein
MFEPGVPNARVGAEGDIAVYGLGVHEAYGDLVARLAEEALAVHRGRVMHRGRRQGQPPGRTAGERRGTARRPRGR